jgi:hypothetical protein
MYCCVLFLVLDFLPCVGYAPVTQQLGRAVYLAGLEGILVRSAADFSGRNLAVFADNLKQGSYLKIVAADRLLDA